MKTIAFAAAALAAIFALPSQAASFDMLSCCPGEDTSTEARFVWHSDSNACTLWYAKASAPEAAVEAHRLQATRPLLRPPAAPGTRARLLRTDPCRRPRHPYRISLLRHRTRIISNGTACIFTEDATARFRRACHTPRSRRPTDRQGRRRQATSEPPRRLKPPEGRVAQ